jgi:hypothetical protein
MNLRLALTLVTIAVATSACSTRSWYDGLQASAASDCNRRPPSERDACIARLNTLPYDQYEKARTKPAE